MPLDPSLNTAPEAIRHIHLMGICGTGVGALAGMLQQAGYTISGSDQHVYPPMSDFLSGLGIKLQNGYQPANLEPRPDLVIVGNVVTRKNPEAAALAELRIPYLSMPQALGHFFLTGKTSIVACGTHGKTTTASLLATMLHEAGQDPGFLIGGIVQAFNRNFRIGNGQYFVVEGDEYDTAFFDKGPKFLHYQPRMAIITSIEFDHADIYADLEAIKTSFKKLVAIMPPDGRLIANLDDEVVRDLVAQAPCPVIGYGMSGKGLWSMTNLAVQPDGTSFTAMKGGHKWGEFKTRMPGRHNAMNTLAVLAVHDQLGMPAELCARHLATFAGVRRRQEVRGIAREITVIDDFAHHPTAVRETLAALGEAYQGHRLLAVFEPRTNSSRRDIFQKDYAAVFDRADQIIIKDPTPLTDLATHHQFSAAQLVKDLTERGKAARHFAATEDIIHHLATVCRQGDVIAIMSNGGFDNIHTRLLATLGATAAPALPSPPVNP